MAWRNSLCMLLDHYAYCINQQVSETLSSGVQERVC